MLRRALLTASLIAPIVVMGGCAQPMAPSSAKPVVVFFTADSAALDTGAQSSIRQAAETAAAQPSAPVRVRGFATPDAGSTAFNDSLSRTRAQAVADALANAGVAPARIRIEARGAVAYDLFPTESRRVEIIVGS